MRNCLVGVFGQGLFWLNADGYLVGPREKTSKRYEPLDGDREYQKLVHDHVSE